MPETRSDRCHTGHDTSEHEGDKSVNDYIMGSSRQETRRLDLQSRLYARHTKHLLELAGITAGMTVLDVGCGTGEVTQIVARLVGPSGRVVGVDADEGMLAVAARNMADARLDNVSFQQATLPDIPLTRPVDALVGRLILMHLDDPVDAVRTMARHVRPGGIVTFQDFNVTRSRTVPTVPLMDDVVAWIVDAIRRGGRNSDPGDRLYAILRDAGLPTPRVAMTAPAGDADSEVAAHATATLATVLPLVEKTRATMIEEMGIDSLLDRLREDMRKAGSVMFSPELVGAWTRTPGF
ncbi:class I SAM-dependent methyltransferase [Streptomyces sp. Ru62]|uniref:class I SAM-dependent methyltransferase n=1 Tax=Streptomyces sp. Ru62 TaxID=2080745 RepID=UPI000CDE29E6|nr:class I SAM-dependent methyltransferase [Streptomyces sp. Ru62]POX58756.1 class I SAM-dependent methyltransferase [Streptomyces sp. Ru62]